MITQLAVESVMPMSLVKVAVALLLLLGWGKWAALVDKDAMFYHQNRRLWNGVQMGAGVLGFFVLLMVPIFFVSLLLAVLIIFGAAGAYVWVRNGSVAEAQKWRFDAEFFRQMVLAKREEHAIKAATLRFPAPPKDLKPVPLAEEPAYGAHLIAEQILEASLRQGASRVDIAGTDQQFLTQVTIDGVDYRQSPMPPADAVAMIDYLKAQAKMDVADRRRKQTGECLIDLADLGQHQVRVHTAGSTKGLTCTILFDAEKQLAIPFKDLGLLEGQRQALEPIIEAQAGVVLIAAPARSGRTTTLYALVAKHDPYTQSIVTIESSVEKKLEGVTQVTAESAEVAKTLNTQLLRDPAVAAVSTLADPETAQVAARAGAEGKRIYCGIKADDTFQALQMWLKAVGDTQLATRSLAAIVSQRLLRKLCTYCRAKYKPDADALRKINLPADRIDTLYKVGGQVQGKHGPEPCPNCSGRGFSGLTAAFEVMPIDDEARKLIVAGQLDPLRAHLRRNKTLWLQEAALAKVVNGTTAIAEVMRVLAKDKQ